MSVELALLLFVLVMAAIIIFGTVFVFYQMAQDKAVNRHNRLYRYRPDLNGNKDSYFDPATGTMFEPRPGNTAYPENVMIINGVQKQIERKNDNTPLLINAPLATRIVRSDEVEGEKVSESSEIEGENAEMVKSLPEAEGILTPQEIARLRDAKAHNLAKTSSIMTILNVQPGKSQRYKAAVAIWDKL